MNVLLITADQWRGDCLSALGHPCVATPALDALAAEGVLFRRHFTQAAPCGPARASLFTGMYLQNHRSGINGMPLDARHGNLALEARAAGYDPVLFGYTDTTPDPRGLALDDPRLRTYAGVLPGFTAELHLPAHHRPWIADLVAKGYDPPRGDYEMFCPAPDYAGPRGQGPTFAPTFYTAEESLSAFMTDAVLRYLSVHEQRPWFVHASYLQPHPPYIAPEPYNAMVDPEAVNLPVRANSIEAEAAQHPFLKRYLEVHREKPFHYTDGPQPMAMDEAQLRQLRATYYGMVAHVDHQIGRLIDGLKRLGAYEDTLIIFTSDHGELLGDHWICGKESYFDGAFHIPLIVRDPRGEARAARGRQVDDFTEHVDLMPTVLSWLGLATPRQCDGRSLLGFTHGGAPADWRREVHWEFDFRGCVGAEWVRGMGLSRDHCTLNVIRDERYKYVHFTALPPLFFDLAEDPDEFHNLADDPTYTARVLDYAQRMLSWRMHNDERVLTGFECAGGLIDHTAAP